MTKAKLVEVVRERAWDEHRIYGKKLTLDDVEAVLAALGKIVATELAFGGRVLLPGIGMLDVKTRKARKGRHPLTSAELTIPACKIVRLRVAGVLKEAVNR